MKTFYINQETGDYELDEKRQLKMVEGDDAIRQGLWVLLSTNLGEYFLNREMGFDRFEILGKKYNEDVTIQEVTNTILQHDLIESVEAITIFKDGRKMKVEFVALKVDGEPLEGVMMYE